MKKIILVLLLSLLCFLVVANAADESNPSDLSDILQRGTLRVGMVSDDNPPFIMQASTGNPTGYDIDLVNDIAQRLGVKISFNYTAKNFDELVKLVSDGEVDLATTITPTLERAKIALFSEPYMTPKLALFTNRLAFANQHLHVEDLNDPQYHIGYLKNSAYYDLAKEIYPTATLVPYEDIHKAIKDVMENRLLAVILDEPHLRIWLHHNPQGNLYGQATILKYPGIPLTLAVTWKNQHLREWLNQYLENARRDGTLTSLVTKYFN